MGERNNAIITLDPEKPPLYLYWHWLGENVSVAIQDGIKAALDRWDDPSYCARIIVHNAWDSSVGADQTTGAGLAFRPDDQDGYYLPVEVDIPGKKVTIGNSSWDFAEYVMFDHDMLRKLTMARGGE